MGPGAGDLTYQTTALSTFRQTQVETSSSSADSSCSALCPPSDSHCHTMQVSLRRYCRISFYNKLHRPCWMLDMILRGESWTHTARCLGPRTSLDGATLTNQRSAATPSWVGGLLREDRSMQTSSPGRIHSVRPPLPRPRALSTTPPWRELHTARGASPSNLRDSLHPFIIQSSELSVQANSSKIFKYRFIFNVCWKFKLHWLDSQFYLGIYGGDGGFYLYVNCRLVSELIWQERVGTEWFYPRHPSDLVKCSLDKNEKGKRLCQWALRYGGRLAWSQLTKPRPPGKITDRRKNPILFFSYRGS